MSGEQWADKAAAWIADDAADGTVFVRQQLAMTNPDDAAERARLEGEVARLREALEKIITYEEDICLSEMLHTSERMNACVRIARKALRHDPR